MPQPSIMTNKTFCVSMSAKVKLILKNRRAHPEILHVYSPVHPGKLAYEIAEGDFGLIGTVMVLLRLTYSK